VWSKEAIGMKTTYGGKSKPLRFNFSDQGRMCGELSYQTRRVKQAQARYLLRRRMHDATDNLGSKKVDLALSCTRGSTCGHERITITLSYSYDKSMNPSVHATQLSYSNATTVSAN
jgi:hypothetical protein